MTNRFKSALVESYVGAIALGWLFSQGLLQLAYIVTAPFTGWLSRREYERFYAPITEHHASPVFFSLGDSLAPLVKCVCILLLGYALLRWLYYKPAHDVPETSESNS